MDRPVYLVVEPRPQVHVDLLWCSRIPEPDGAGTLSLSGRTADVHARPHRRGSAMPCSRCRCLRASQSSDGGAVSRFVEPDPGSARRPNFQVGHEASPRFLPLPTALLASCQGRSRRDRLVAVQELEKRSGAGKKWSGESAEEDCSPDAYLRLGSLARLTIQVKGGQPDRSRNRPARLVSQRHGLISRSGNRPHQSAGACSEGDEREPVGRSTASSHAQ